MGRLPTDGIEIYWSSFARRSAGTSEPHQTVISEPGICGVLGTAEHGGGRLLITDDRAVSALASLGPQLRVHVVTVLAAAERCGDLIEQAGPWQSEAVTAMICRDLTTLPALALPPGLTIRPVCRAPGDPIDGVPLAAAAQACLRVNAHAEPDPLPGFLAYLRSLPANTRLLAAVDDQGVVRATAGSSVTGADAHAFFVATDEAWRHRGVATAMTAAALGWARAAGATMAFLDATPAGLSIYLRLGFETVSRATKFARSG